MIKNNEKGRSMVEMFGILAIVGVSFELHRFVYILYPFAAIILTALISLIVENLSFTKKTKKIIFVMFIPLLIVLSLRLKTPDFQYREYNFAVSKLDKLKNYDALMYYNGFAVEQHYTSYPLSVLPDETYYFNEYDIKDLPRIMEKRKTKDPLVVIITGSWHVDDILRNILSSLRLRSYRLIHTYQAMQFYELR